MHSHFGFLIRNSKIISNLGIRFLGIDTIKVVKWSTQGSLFLLKATSTYDRLLQSVVIAPL